jgi:IS4 transposase
MNRTRLYHTRKTLEKFVDTSLGLDYKKNSLSSKVISASILGSCALNTYIETICNKSDAIFRNIKLADSSMATFSYLDFIKQVSKKINLNKKKVMLAFDYTKEIFWGDVQGLDIYGTKKSEKGTGKFQFLTCSQVSDKIHAKIPLISIPVQMGHNKSHVISYCLSLIKKYVGDIELILFDREYYIKELLMTLNHLNYPYLIFVPKSKGEIQNTLKEMYVGETKTKIHEFKVNKNKSNYIDETLMAFLKDAFDIRSGLHFDWCFVTNVKDFDVNKMVSTYKYRWRIETGFRVQDDADSKSNSRNMKIRYFMFLYEQLLQSTWYVFYKKEEEVSFKQFILALYHMIVEDKVIEGSKIHRMMV